MSYLSQMIQYIDHAAKVGPTVLFVMAAFLGCAIKSSEAPLQKPDDNRFTKVVLTRGLDEPMEMTFLPDDKILLVERKGGVKVYDEANELMIPAGFIEVNTKYTNRKGEVREAEEGLMGVVADPSFVDNHWIYLYYADPDTPQHLLTRWDLQGDLLVEGSEKVLLKVPTQREECCHTGGGMVFDKEGNLYLTTGNNTVNPRTGASNLDERPGHENSDDQRGPSNSNDYRGKILRIYPEEDGTYSIPEGNLFPPGTPKTLPEIYPMGHRNPWRPTIDSKTGFLYWGEVGPDASKDSIWGPNGYDEFNQARGPGFFGWPYFIGDNKPYHEYDAETNTYGAPFDPLRPVNESVNNTGIRELPQPIPALIWYPYGPSQEFPLMGSAGRSATGGPIYRNADFLDPIRPFSPYYEGKWFIVDFMRDWIIAVEMDADGNYVGMEKIIPQERFNAVIDMDFGPNGDLYLLEYGDAWFKGNPNAQIVKVEYNAGNRKPSVKVSANPGNGRLPLIVEFSGAGSSDADAEDQGNLRYDWTITSDQDFEANRTTRDFSLTLTDPGEYQARLIVTDTRGATNMEAIDIIAGNSAPTIEIQLPDINQSFYFEGQTVAYQIDVQDEEDGLIHSDEVAVTFDYVPAGYDPVEVAQKHAGSDLLVADAISRNLISNEDCESCHQFDAPSIGPSYTAVANKYKATPEIIQTLVGRIIDGSTGIWGEHAMSAHPGLKTKDAERMVRYILDYQNPKPSVKLLPLSGQISLKKPPSEPDGGSFLIRAKYRDRGSEGAPPLTTEELFTLVSPRLFPQMADHQENVQYLTTLSARFDVLGPQAMLGWDQIDLSHLTQIEFFVQTLPRLEARGGTIEVRIDSVDGKIIGQSEFIRPQRIPRSVKQADLLDPDSLRRQTTLQALVDLEETVGFHDVYFIFRNSDAKASEILLTVVELEFYSPSEVF